ncbi:nuclear transport factor 2 family protein [Actinomadura sp. KC345]|uniref:nuclear transport factor 2 family protein n=1 Tax=Actinomadura sp. KC345 TaxID=2530371 RepID=UPI00104A5D16|nr:nuclear transport factor 2 family protein [Actinomadura sp. KC345]TDC50789.1 nuclear transport factor 2 family protein [Actinomadura sp. KC345]
MRPLDDSDPKQFIADYLTSFNDELAHGDDDPALVIDRYHTPDIVQIADGRRWDREKLIAHARPLRKNRPTSRVEVHEAIADGDRIAACYTMRVKIRGKDLTFEFGLFGRFAPDGRMCHAYMFAREVPADSPQPGHSESDGKQAPA